MLMQYSTGLTGPERKFRRFCRTWSRFVGETKHLVLHSPRNISSTQLEQICPWPGALPNLYSFRILVTRRLCIPGHVTTDGSVIESADDLRPGGNVGQLASARRRPYIGFC